MKSNVFSLNKFIGFYLNDQQRLIINMIFGKCYSLAESTQHLFLITGMSHLLSASAYNVGVILQFASTITNQVHHRIVRFYLNAGVLLGYFFLSDKSISIQRAMVMRILFYVAQLQGRQYLPSRALWFFIVSFLLIDRLLINSIGFQLSCLATVSLIIKSQIFIRSKHQDFFSGWWQEEVLSSVFVNLFLAPVLLWHFGEYSFLSLLITPLIFWLVPWLTKGGLVWLLLRILFINWFLERFFVFPLEGLLIYLSEFLLIILEWGSSYSWLKIELINLNWKPILAYYLALAGFLFFLKKKVEQKYSFLCKKYFFC